MSRRDARLSVCTVSSVKNIIFEKVSTDECPWPSLFREGYRRGLLVIFGAFICNGSRSLVRVTLPLLYGLKLLVLCSSNLAA